MIHQNFPMGFGRQTLGDDPICGPPSASGLLPEKISELLGHLEGGDLEAEVAPGCEWTLLLVLHLLRELRNPKSPWQAYTQLLPAPPGSLLRSICSRGPNATDLLLFRCLSTSLTLTPQNHAGQSLSTQFQSCLDCSQESNLKLKLTVSESPY